MIDWISPSASLLAVAVIGMCVGSFLNVVIHRLPKMLEHQWRRDAASILDTPVCEHPKLNLALPRSYCPHCGHAISAEDNIPILSYLILRGHCRHCKKQISLRYPLVELMTAVLSVAVLLKFGTTLYSLGALIFVWSLIALSLIDFDTQLLPDDITLPLIWGGILFNLATQSIPLEQSVIGAVSGYLSLWSIYWLFKLTTGKEGMGYGDFKLLAGIGAFLGWKAILFVVLISSCIGAAAGIALLCFSKLQRNTPIPFGPYLAVAGVVGLLTTAPDTPDQMFVFF